VSLLLALSAYESGWGESRQATRDNNPLGITPNGFTPVRFASVADAWKAFAQEYAPRLQGVKTDAQKFTALMELDNRHVYGPTFGGDHRGSYNSANLDWPDGVQNEVASIEKRLPDWIARTSQSGHRK
jgi:hypothetical protein